MVGEIDLTPRERIVPEASDDLFDGIVVIRHNNLLRLFN